MSPVQSRRESKQNQISLKKQTTQWSLKRVALSGGFSKSHISSASKPFVGKMPIVKVRGDQSELEVSSDNSPLRIRKKSPPKPKPTENRQRATWQCDSEVIRDASPPRPQAQLPCSVKQFTKQQLGPLEHSVALTVIDDSLLLKNESVSFCQPKEEWLCIPSEQSLTFVNPRTKSVTSRKTEFAPAAKYFFIGGAICRLTAT